LQELPIPYCPHTPTDHQSAFLLTDDLGLLEVLYGGAAGGGKSDALLMSALRYVDVPGYSALILRRTYADLSLPGAIMDRAKAWLMGKVQWSDHAKTFTFPSGATLTFGYLDTANDMYRYQGAELQYCAFDELTQFEEQPYRYLFSRLRRKAGVDVPLRMRAASNPGGVGHEWVRVRFLDSREPNRAFIPAKLVDNPHLDRDEYERSLSVLHPVDQARLRDGDWSANYDGGFFRREWLAEIVDAAPVAAKRVRAWDKAATPGAGDYTAGVKMAKTPDGTYYVEHVVRGQWAGPERERIILATAEADTRDVTILLEQEPGSGGKDSAQSSVKMLAGFAARAETATGDKMARAKPFAAQCYAGNVKLVRGPWLGKYLDELVSFPSDGSHDDQVDASSGAFNYLSRMKSGGAW
jgi:predicted phage terminase large subunit-like protein